MRKILFTLAVLALLTSCRSFPIYTENVHYLDLSKYQSDGFKVYVSEFVNFEYVNVGVVEVTVYDGVARTDGKPMGDTYKEGSKEYEDLVKSSKMKYSTIDDAFLALINKCKEQGANGVIGVITEPIRAKEYSEKTRLSDVIGYRITGVAIKK